MNQKGFIPIIFIIIGVVMAASATFGVVKYKAELTANVSRGVETKNDEISEKLKLQEQLKIAEQKRLEAEKQLVEESTRQAAEKAKAEEVARVRAEQELQQQLEVQKLAKEQQELLNQQELKIEKCKAESQLVVDRYKNQLGALYLGQGQEAIKTWENSILAYKQEYARCTLSTYKELTGAPWELQKDAAASCNWYLDEANRLQQQLAQKRLQMDSLFEWAEKMGQQEYSRIYLECLNK